MVSSRKIKSVNVAGLTNRDRAIRESAWLEAVARVHQLDRDDFEDIFGRLPDDVNADLRPRVITDLPSLSHGGRSNLRRIVFFSPSAGPGVRDRFGGPPSSASATGNI
jgi:hypothetical protein